MAEKYADEDIVYLDVGEIGPGDEFLEECEEWYRDFELEEMCEVKAAVPPQGAAVLW